MAFNNIINVHLFGQEIGRIGTDEHERRSSFQFNPAYLASGQLQNIFPLTGIIKKTKFVQLFSQFEGDTFKGIPPQFADSLPDRFGSIIFKAWMDSHARKNISTLEQLAYVGKRGMGALEYFPVIDLPQNTTLDLSEIIEVLKEVLDLKKFTEEKLHDNQALINIFKIGSSAGGARPKILISEHKQSGNIIPGDLEISNDYHHYLVKLAIDNKVNYPREIIEYCYYQTIRNTGIRMMDSKLIDDQHFATLRFDRQNGEKKHVLTASGMTGWDFKNPAVSSYENLFELSLFLKISHAQMEELFRRMIFNIVFGNIDDHLKNHAFIYIQEDDRWELAPAYDITFTLNPLISFKKPKRALSINGKRNNIFIEDVLKISEMFTIKNPKGVIQEIQSHKKDLLKLFGQYDVPKSIYKKIDEYIIRLL